MNDNRLMQQVSAVFSVFMVVFYLGIGIFFAFFFNQSYLDKAVRVIVGSSFILYGIYKAYRSYVKISEAFFQKKND